MTFDERFMLVYPRIQAIAKKYSYAYPVPHDEYESMMCEEFIKIDASFDGKVNDSYSSYVGSKLDQVALRMSGADRKERRFHDSIEPFDLPDGDEEERKYPVELIADVDIEEQVFDEMFVEEQLAKADELGRKILAEFFADPHASFRNIADTLGIHHATVKSRLTIVAEAVRNA